MGSTSVCSPTKMHIQSILAEKYKGKFGKVRITVFDNCGSPVPSAEVIGTFSGDFIETRSAMTDANGVAEIYTIGEAKNPSYTFCTDDVIRETLDYDPNANIETCDGI